MESTKVLYIAGKGRSGSTILDVVLGEAEGFFAAGEVRYLWDLGLGKGFRCGCSRPVAECEVWSRVVELALAPEGGGGRIDPRSVLGWYEDIFRWPALPRLLRAARTGRVGGWRALEHYTDVMSRVYGALADLSGARVIIDSAKWIGDPTLLRLVPGVDAYCLHLIRDPRAVTHSWKRLKYFPDRGKTISRYPSVYSAGSWLLRNLAVEAVRRRIPRDRYLCLRYEDFVADPRGALERITGFVGEPAGSFPFLDGRTVSLEGPNHTVSGNPSRYADGAVVLREDDEWRGELGPLDRAITTLVTLPILGRYGYPIRTRLA